VGKNLKVISSAALLISFFLPWFSNPPEHLSGLTIAQMLTSPVYAYFLEGYSSLAYLLYLIPVLAILSLIKSKVRVLTLATAILSFILIAILTPEIGLEYLSFGGYLTYIAAIVLFIASFSKDTGKKKEDGSSKYHDLNIP